MALDLQQNESDQMYASGKILERRVYPRLYFLTSSGHALESMKIEFVYGAIDRGGSNLEQSTKFDRTVPYNVPHDMLLGQLPGQRKYQRL